MSSSKRVVCLGVIVADLIGRPVPSLPQRAGMVVVDDMRLFPGGGAVNTAVALSRLGIPVSVVGRVGEDYLGDYLINCLVTEGIDCQGITRDELVGTSATMVMVDPDGERRFVHYIGANGKLTASQLPEDLIESAAILHIAYAFVLPGIDGTPMAELLLKAQQSGVITVLDTAWDVSGRWLDILELCLPYVDYFIPNLAEGQAISNMEEPLDVARGLIDLGPRNVVLKMNKGGCLYWDENDRVVRAPAYDVDVIDSTGAGDSFDAGIIAGIYHGWSVDRSAQFANAVGALCVGGYGAAGKVESAQATLDFMKDRTQTEPSAL